jgi:D-sedoheptulose 7-phosphate isomerase
MEKAVLNGLCEARQFLDAMIADTELQSEITRASLALAEALGNRRRVFACGNGGSMCDAMHFAEELSGRYHHDRPALAATAISDVGHLTCVSNDYGYDHVFARYLEGHGRPGDFLLAISTSGSSLSILNAVRVAHEHDMRVIGLHGRKGSPLSLVSDFDICTPSGLVSGRVQECHIKVIHIMIEIVEQVIFR